MRVIFMGTPDFAVGTLEAILAAGHEVVLAVTQPDRPKNRGKAMQAPPVKECALKHGIPVCQPVKIRDAEEVERIFAYRPDIIVVAAFGQILPKEILDLPRYGCINVHASLLPKYRGAAPIQWAVINGDAVSGVTIMRMDVGLDTGDMIEQREITLAEDETGGSLFEKLSAEGARLCVETMEKIAAGTAVFTAGCIKSDACGHDFKRDGKYRLESAGRSDRTNDPGIKPMAKRLYQIKRKDAENLARKGKSRQKEQGCRKNHIRREKRN